MKCECCGQTIREPTSDKFNEFWAVYPSKVDKIDSKRIWKKSKLDSKADMIIEHVRHRLDVDPRWSAGYIMSPKRFLGKELWTDEIDTAPKVMQWPKENKDWEALGRKHGVNAGAGEGWPQFKERIKRTVGG